jgi:predicted membrane metal-binding protein
MLLYNPYYLVYDLGFILSFLAIIWILTFNIFQIKTWNDQYIPAIIAYKTTFKEWKKSLSWVKDKVKYVSTLFIIKFRNDYFLPTMWASIFTAPAILFFTKQVNLLAFIASLIVIPFVPLIMLVNIIALIMLIVWIPGYELLVQANKPLLDLIFYMSDLIGNHWTVFIKW